MKFNRPLAALVLFLGMLMGQSALATTPVANCDILYADQNSNAGQVCVTIDRDAGTVSIDYLLDAGWTLTDAHVWVGEDLALMPKNRKGNPQVGRFPHRSSGLGNVSTHSFVIPLSQLPINANTFCNAEVFVAAHAVVSDSVISDADKSGKSDHSGKSGKSGKAGKAAKSGKSAQSGKSGSSESAWAGINQITSGDSWARYFSFTNDFCGNTDPEYPVVVLPPNCFNVFGKGVTDTAIEMPVAVTPFSPVGVTDTSSAWRNTYASAPGYFAGDLLSGNATVVGKFFAGEDQGLFAIELALDVIANPSLTVHSANVYYNVAGAYQTQSPVDYNLKFTGNGTGSVYDTASSPIASQASSKDVVVHVIVCTNGVID